MTMPHEPSEFPPDPPPDVLERLYQRKPRAEPKSELAAWSGTRYKHPRVSQPDLFDEGKDRKP